MVQMIPERRTREALVLISNEHRWSMWVLAGILVRAPSLAYYKTDCLIIVSRLFLIIGEKGSIDEKQDMHKMDACM